MRPATVTTAYPGDSVGSGLGIGNHFELAVAIALFPDDASRHSHQTVEWRRSRRRRRESLGWTRGVIYSPCPPPLSSVE
jgi:hypothetical protein